MSARPPDVTLRFRPATPSRWPDVEAVFGERGACGGCWCMAWRLSHGVWKAGKGAKNRNALKKLVGRGDPPGILGYLGGKPVAWCSVAPRESFPFLERSRVLSAVDDKPVWSISCLFILKPHRRQGLSAHLLEAAVEFASRRGAKIVEGYPTLPYVRSMPDTFLWTGILSAFERAGFVEVARRSERRPVVRRICP